MIKYEWEKKDENNNLANQCVISQGTSKDFKQKNRKKWRNHLNLCLESICCSAEKFKSNSELEEDLNKKRMGKDRNFLTSYSKLIDEVLGIYFILLFIKIDYNQLLLNFLIIFLLFRFFDITKIFPMNIIEKKYDNAFGIIADDLVAGFFSVLCYLVIYNFIVL